MWPTFHQRQCRHWASSVGLFVAGKHNHLEDVFHWSSRYIFGLPKNTRGAVWPKDPLIHFSWNTRWLITLLFLSSKSFLNCFAVSRNVYLMLYCKHLGIKLNVVHGKDCFRQLVEFWCSTQFVKQEQEGRSSLSPSPSPILRFFFSLSLCFDFV